MAYILKLLYGYTNILDEYGDPRVENWFFLGTPFRSLGVFFLYYYIVLSIIPKIMRTKPAFELNKLLIVYNFLQIISSFYVVYLCLNTGILKYDLRCQNVQYSKSPQAIDELKICFIYFLLKVVDLLDTLFFALRKKDNQMSFLHLYHHGGMVLFSGLITKFFGGGTLIFIPFINSIIHTVMYFYYLLSALNKDYQTSVWWKKYLTQIQIIQFMVLFVIFTRTLTASECNIPRWFAWVFIVQNIYITTLFIDFYLKSYVFKRKTLVNIQTKSPQIELNEFTLHQNDEKHI